jgi:hypothetical protein
MKEFTFPAWVEFGRNDYGETLVSVSLADEEADRLIKFGTRSEIYYNGFSQCDEIRDIYDKVYTAAVDQITDELGEDWLDGDERADEKFSCGVKFPVEFEDMLEAEGEDD